MTKRSDYFSMRDYVGVCVLLALAMPGVYAENVCISCCQPGSNFCLGMCKYEVFNFIGKPTTMCLYDGYMIVIRTANEEYGRSECYDEDIVCLSVTTTTSTTSTTTTTSATTSSTTITTTTSSSTRITSPTTTLTDPGYASGGFRNIYSILQLNASNDELSDPAHNMSEYAFFNRSSIYAVDGTNVLDSGSIVYMINAGYIPMTLLADEATGKYLDYEYKGKILIFGKEYYVRDIIGTDTLYACSGTIVQTDNLGFFGDFLGYKFKLDSLIYGSGNALSGVSLDVKRPDGTILQKEITGIANGLVDELEIRVLNTSISGSRIGVQLLIYDLESEITLKEGVSYSIGGVVNNEWVASIITVEQPLSGSVNILPYHGIGLGQNLLANISLVFTGSKNISTGTNLSMPSGYKVISDGSDLAIVNYSACDLIGDFPPCGAISLQEIIGHITKWSTSHATLSQVITMIDLWAEQ